MRNPSLLVALAATLISSLSCCSSIPATTKVIVLTTVRITTLTAYETAKPIQSPYGITCTNSACHTRSESQKGISPKWTNTTQHYQTISLTNSITKTVTNVVTPPDVTLTVIQSSFSQSQSLPPNSSSSSPQSSLRVVTVTVYPLPASQNMDTSWSQALPHPQNTTKITSISRSIDDKCRSTNCACGPVSSIRTQVAANYETITDQSKMTSMTSMGINSSHGSFIDTTRPELNYGGKLEPNAWIIRFAQILPFVSLARAQWITNGFQDTRVGGRFYPVQGLTGESLAKLSPTVPRVHRVSTSDMGSITATISLTLTTTSTVTVKPLVLNNFASLPVTQTSTDSMLKAGTYSPWWSSVQNMTVVSTFTASAIMDTLTATSIIPNIVNVTKNVTSNTHTTVTLTETIEKSTQPFTGPETGASTNVGASIFLESITRREDIVRVMLCLPLLQFAAATVLLVM